MLIRSISGIRGLVDEDLKNDSIIKYANALNELFPEGVIYAGRDSRPSGEDIAQIMINKFNHGHKYFHLGPSKDYDLLENIQIQKR